VVITYFTKSQSC